MMRNRWQHVAFAATMAFVVVLAAVTWSPWHATWPVYLLVAVVVAAYGSFGRRGYDDPRAAAVFVPLLIVATFGMVAIAPSTAFVQCIVFPLLWRQIPPMRIAVLTSIGVGVAVGAGFLVSLGVSAETFAQIAIIEGASVVGSIALGVWISNISTVSASRQRLLDELESAQASLAALHRAAGVAGERERIARELHDTIAQNLAGIVMLAQRSRRDLSAGRLDDDRLALIEDSAKDALEESRTLVAAGAAGLASGGLGAALHRLGERLGRETGIAVTVDAADADIDRDTQVVLLRVAQECLANVRAHAGASAVRLTLTTGRTGGTGLRIADDGHGFDTAAPAPGYGLRGIRERLALAGGSFDVESSAAGTVVTAVVGGEASSDTPTRVPASRPAVVR